MYTKWVAACLYLLFSTSGSFAQYTTVFAENFETCGVGNVPICQWNLFGSGSRWTTTASACAISGTYSLAVGSDVNFCEYNMEFGVSDIIAYRQFNAAAFHDLTLAFDWKSVGETNVDYGQVVWSGDGISWSNVTGALYQNQATARRDTLVLDPSLENDPTAYIGFRWFDDAANGAFPGFVVDNINIRGEPDTPAVPATPISSFPVACDSVVISWGGASTSPNVIWYWQDTVCGGNSMANDSSNYIVYTSGTYYISAYNTVSGLWSNDCDSITVTVITPPVANAGPPGVECDLDFQFSAVPSVGIGTWTQFFGPGTATFSNPNSPTDTVTVSAYGVYLFEWTEANGNCISSDMVTVGFYEQPVSNAGAGNVSCTLTSTLTATASVGQGTWTQLAGPVGATSTFANTNSAFTDVTVDSSGTYVYRWVEVNGSCSDTDTVSFSFFNPPVADAGASAVVLCDTSYTFNAALVSGTGSWSQTLGPGLSSISNINDPSATVSVNAVGTYIYQWTTVEGLCTNSDTMIVSFDDPLITDAGTGGIVCDLNTVLGASTSIGTGIWNQSSGPGTATFVNAMSPTTTVSVSNEGTYVLNWTETLGTCVDSEDVTIIFVKPIDADAGPDVSVSLGNSVTLSGTGGMIYQWDPDTFLNFSNIPDPLVSPLQTTTYVLTVMDNSGCLGLDTVVVTVDIDYNFVVSNAMTPNGDGHNDIWYIDNIDFYSECEVSIYNRYGSLLYKKSGYLNDWDGTSGGQALPDGTYYYVITCPGSQKIFKGGITILKK